MWSWLKIFGLFGVLLSMSNCGYTLSHRLKEPFTDPRGISVRVFDNYTDEIGAEAAFTNALIRELQSRGQVELKSTSSGALELRGALNSIDQEVTSSTDPGLGQLADYRRLPAQIGIRTRVSLNLYDPATKKVIWEQSFNTFHRLSVAVDRNQSNFAPSATGPITQSLFEAKFPDIARDVMREVYDEMVVLF